VQVRLVTGRTPSQIGKANRAAGIKLENETRKVLIEAGWAAIASKRSIGAADVVAVAPLLPLVPFLHDRLWFVQCKSNGYVSPAGRDMLEESARKHGARAVVAYWHKEGRSARVVKFRDLQGQEVKP
jgi:hypothetical protein